MATQSHGPFCSPDRAQEIIQGWGRVAKATGRQRTANPFTPDQRGHTWHNEGWDAYP